MNGRRQRFRLGVAAIGIGALILAGSLKAAPTEAAWADAELASSPAVTAGARPDTPVITSCTVSTLLGSGLVFTGVMIVWTSPYLNDRVQLRINDVVITTGIVRTGTGPYTYTATLSATLLQSVLGGLLGSSNSVTVRAFYPGGSWESATANKTLSVGGLLGVSGSNRCP